MPTRRRYLQGLGIWAAGSLLSATETEAADPSKLNELNRELADPSVTVSVVEETWAFREYDDRVFGPTDDQLRAQPNLSKRFSSDKSISVPARSLIVKYEVSGQAVYESKYQTPIWPGGQSGLTIGIGYDLGYCSPEDFSDDWGHLIAPALISRLTAVCGKTGPSVQSLPLFYSDAVIDWAAATNQLNSFLKLVAGQVIDAFPKSDQLTANSFGALVSLAYNRGTAMHSRAGDPLDSRREMRAVRDLISGGHLSEVGQQIRAMKRIWEGNPKARGLLSRRDAEATLFEVDL